MKKLIVLATGLIVLAPQVFGAPLAPLRMMVQKGDAVEIRGFKGSLEYVVQDRATDLTVSIEQISTGGVPARTLASVPNDEWQFSFRREGSNILAVIDGPSSKQAWGEVLVSGAMPEYNMKITGPSLPLNINWNEGRIVVPGLEAELKITALKADIIVTKGEGAASIVNQEGSVTLKDRTGELRIDSYFAKVDVENVEGRLDLENFTGDTRVNQVSGDLNLNVYKGVTKVTSAKGRLEFRNGLSPIHIEKFEGELRGRSGQGSVFADVRGDANIRLESAEGAVNLRLPASGAWVNVGTEEGALVVPSFLKLTRMSTQQMRTGRLKGSSGGTVFVRTASGDIHIRP